MSRALRAGGAARLLALALAAMTPAYGCRSKPSGDGTRLVASAAAHAGAAGGSSALVASPKHDFGHVTQGDTLKHAFPAHNGTSEVLSVEDALEVLGCSGVAVPSVIEPGHDARVEVTCRAVTPGPLRVSLPLSANGRRVGELLLSGEVEPLLAFERSVVELSLPFGEERRVEVRLRGKRAKEARLSPAAAPPPYAEVSVLPGDAEKPEAVAVRATGKGVGTHVGSLRFATGLAEPREVALSYVVKVAGTLAVSPTNPVVQLGAGGPSRVVVKVTSTQPGFGVTRAEILDGPFTARVRRASEGYEVELTALGEKMPAGARGANGRLRILSNDRTEPDKEVPLFALGAPFGAR